MIIIIPRSKAKSVPGVKYNASRLIRLVDRDPLKPGQSAIYEELQINNGNKENLP
jgi:hypothetical protein